MLGYDSAIGNGDVLTPSLLSRAGSPTLPLMNEKTRSRSGSRRGSLAGGAERSGSGTGSGVGGFAFGLGGFHGGLGMSMAERKKKEGEFVGSVDCGTT